MDLHRAIEVIRRQAAVIADPRSDPSASLFAGRTTTECERAVMTHFYYSFGRDRLGLTTTRHLPKGEDPPDYRCRNADGRCVGVELVGLMDEAERKENCYRRKRARIDGRHEHSLGVPYNAHPLVAQLCRERPEFRIYTIEQGLAKIRDSIIEKGSKVRRRRKMVGSAWDYDEFILLIWTTHWSLANAPFLRAAQDCIVGEGGVFDHVFFVPEPFIDIGDAFVELTLA